MMDMLLEQQKEQATRRKARVVTTIVHILILVLIFLPFLKYPDPPPGQEGVLISFGEPDVGKGADRPAVAEPSASESSEKEEIEEEQTPPPPPEPEPVKKPELPQPKKAKPEPVPDRPVKTDPNADEVSLRQEEAKKKEEARRQAEQEAREAEVRRAQEAAEQQAREEAERKAQEEAERKAQEEAERKAQEEEARKTKERFSGLFKNDTGGTGRGETDESGNQGQPNGGDSDRLEGISSGDGRVGGGLASRGGEGPKIRDDSQATGRVVIKVCVDASGKVISAQFTQQGSTTNNTTLIAKAEANAREWTFSSGSTSRQCGTITYDFKVK